MDRKPSIELVSRSDAGRPRRTRKPRTRSSARLASGLAVFAIAGLWVAFSSAAGAAVTTPLVSTSTSESGGGTVGRGSGLHVTFNETPVLAASYSLTLTDGSNVATLSSAAGTLSAVVNGNSVDFTVHAATSLSLSQLEVLGSTGVNDSLGNPWDLVASGQVDKALLVAPRDDVVINFNEPVSVGASYSFTLTEGSGSAVIDNGNSTVSSGNGSSTVVFVVTSNPGTVAADGPTVSNLSGVTGVTPVPTTVASGDKLTATLPGTLTAAAAYNLTLTDGSDVGTLAGSSVTTTPSGVNTTVTYTATSNPSMTTGTQLSTTGLQATAATANEGFTPAATLPFTLIVTGPAAPSPSVTSDSVVIDISNTCTNIGVTRVFGGTNCDIGFNNSGPVTPDVYDVIPVPTQDLPGPPNDAAPEVITSCAAGSSDVVYDVNTGAEIGANPCGNNPPGEASIGNTNSNTLDYIPTPNLASFEEVGVVETIPGSTYVSATAVPPQISAITISGNQATFSYYGNVVCQASNGSTDLPTYSSYTYVTPYTKTTLAPGDLVYPTSISCPSGGGSNSVTLTYPGTIPFGSGLRFKFTGFGAGHYIIGAPGSAFADEREASESAYAGPTATITSFTPQSSTLGSSSGGPVGISFGTTGALTCGVGAVSLPASAAALSLPSVASCNGSGTITVPGNTNTTTNAVYTVTLTALGVPGTPLANQEITITVPAAPPPPPSAIPQALGVPADISPPTISGSTTKGQTLTEHHGSWSNTPTSYAYQWDDCGSAGHTCLPIARATGQSYKLTAADVGHTLSVAEIASNVSGPGNPATSSATAVVKTSPAGGTKPHKGVPNTRLVFEQINSKNHTAKFRFKATGKSTGFRCALVRKPTRKRAKTRPPKYSKCRSPKTFKHLKLGSYVLYVRAVGPGGVDKTAATYRFTIRAAFRRRTSHSSKGLRRPL